MYNTPIYHPQYARGGSVKHGLAAAAEQLRRRGRNGDTILAHINPREAGILKLLGGRGTPNPRTGLPEFNFLDDFSDFIGTGGGESVWDQAGNAIDSGLDWAGDVISDAGSWWDDNILQPQFGLYNDVAETLGPIGMIAATYFGGPLGAAIYGGFMAPGDDFSLKGAATSGALAYAGGELLGGGGEGAFGPVGGDAASAADWWGGASQFGDVAGAAAGTGGGAGLSALESAITSVPNWGAQVTGQIPGQIDGITGFAADPVAAAGGGYGGTAGITADELAAAFAEPSASTIQTANVEPITSAGQGETLKSFDTPSDVINKAISEGGAPEWGYQSAAQPASGYTVDPYGGLDKTGLAAIKDYIPSLKQLGDAAKIGFTGMMGYGMYAGLQEGKAQKKAAEEALARQEAKKAEQKAQAEAILGRYPTRYGRMTAEDVQAMGLASGGEIASMQDATFDAGDDFAKGGIAALPPRFLSGGGDGMSDSIPARIAGKQEARLADGEFVVSADVVSGIGNGSSKAGAKKLYAMMDRVRKARTGKKQQAPEIKAERYMPA